MKASFLKAAVVVAWLMIAVEIFVFGLGVLSLATGEIGIGGGAAGLLVQLVGTLRMSLQSLMPPVILLIVIEIYRSRSA